MKRVLIVGAGKVGSTFLEMLHASSHAEIVAVIIHDKNAAGFKLAHTYNIPADDQLERWLNQDVDLVIETTGDSNVLRCLVDSKQVQTVIIQAAAAQIHSSICEKTEKIPDQLQLKISQQEMMLNNVHDGVIVVDKSGVVQFVNKSAEKIVGIAKTHFENRHITKVIRETRLPDILEDKKKETNRKLLLENGRQIVTTRIPIIDEHCRLTGAFAVFKDITEVFNLAGENTDLKEIKTMLEAIIYSSDEAISVADEKGTGLLINPAYTRITGLKEADILGKPVATDISEGESIHLKVLNTRRPVRGERMKVGPGKRDVIVNAAPVIVDGKLKGSVGVLHDVSEIKSLTKELKRARQIIRNLEAKYTFGDIIGSSPGMKLALEQAKIGAKTPATVLLRGGSGTGKELFAHAIHHESERKHHKFIRVNCAAITESILESELFGYEEGAFSGAKRGGKKGLFEEANGGSIFLDEIGEISPYMQAKFLRVLQENEIVRVGGTSPVTIDVRIIAATNINMEKAIMNRSFREDLYYRLNRLPIFIPSLKERTADLPELIRYIFYKINEDYGRNVKGISDEALGALYIHDWPGNIRELENVIGRAMIYMDLNEEIIKRKHIPDLVPRKFQEDTITSANQGDTSLQTAVEAYEKTFISEAYKANSFNKTKTASALRISVRSLYYKIKKYDLEKNSMQDPSSFE
jgi:PAS domain S-box-containing protein